MRRSLRAADATLSPTDLWLLDHISESGPYRMSQLWQEVERATITTQVRRLEDARLAASASSARA